jgi:hypothetical protein
LKCCVSLSIAIAVSKVKSWAIMPRQPSVPNLIGLFIYLTPSVPLSFKGEGEDNFRRGAKPLLNSLNKIRFEGMKPL